MLNVGDQAPDINVQTDSGEDFRLSAMKGKRVVLYFYPRADKPGCTVEACEFRDQIKAFGKQGGAGIGVSPAKSSKGYETLGGGDHYRRNSGSEGISR